MPRKSKRSNKKSSKLKKTKKQKIYIMRGCSHKTKSCKHKKNYSTLGNKNSPNCGPNCGPNCPHHLNQKHIGGTGSGSGSGCGTCGCPLAPLSFKQIKMFGGGCSSCGMKGGMKGGVHNFFKPAGPIPGTTVGSAWGTSVDKWPGVNEVGGDRNYLKPLDSVKDPQLQMSMNDAGYNTLNSKVGGRRRKSRSNSIKGGGLVPQDLVNLGSNFSFNLKSAYNSLNGYKAPIDPLPYKDQLSHNNKILL